MKTYFSVGEAARLAETTSETLRHWDRIGLVCPSKIGGDNGYRYYTNEDIIRINTVKALQEMDLSLKSIKEVLEYDDFSKIIAFFDVTEKNADEKIRLLQDGKERIRRAKAEYQRKLDVLENKENELYIKEFSQRVILLSDSLTEPTLDNLYDYLRHYYDMLSSQGNSEKFSFKDLAGIYTENNLTRLYAECIEYEETEGLRHLPKGKYLCLNCSKENRDKSLRRILDEARIRYGIIPGFYIQEIKVLGILSWSYQIQVYIGL